MQRRARTGSANQSESMQKSESMPKVAQGRLITHMYALHTQQGFPDSRKVIAIERKNYNEAHSQLDRYVADDCIVPSAAQSETRHRFKNHPREKNSPCKQVRKAIRNR